jgi:alkanesulfonate monooxygenase SsuD/methylene tetrahydromethanopterin reductase-like flavin-dependent oxidoreductase (luciferase family)
MPPNAPKEVRSDDLPLRLGLTADSPTAPGAWDQVLAKVRLADVLGFDSIWQGEAWGYELFTSLADYARVTSRIKIGAGVANVFSRSPPVIASAAATLDERSGGRLILGLGSSGPQVVEHWHGVPFEKPLARIGEYVSIINQILRREPLLHHGEIFNLDRRFTLRFRPPREHIPIYLASLSPKSIDQAGAIADGVLPIYWPAGDFPALRDQLDAAATRVGRPAGATRIAPYITAVLVDSEEGREAARRQARGPVAFYVGRMGTFYADMLARHGFGDEVAAIKHGWESGHAGALAAVSDRLLDATAIVGTATEIVATLRAWRRLGVDEPLISMPAGSVDEAAPRLEALARAAGLSRKEQ